MIARASSNVKLLLEAKSLSPVIRMNEKTIVKPPATRPAMITIGRTNDGSTSRCEAARSRKSTT